MKSAKDQLKSVFSITDSGTVAYMLGIQINYNANARRCEFSQTGYIDGILQRYSSEDIKTKDRPSECGSRLTAFDGKAKLETVAKYASIVGSLQWLAQGTRPDIAYQTSTLSRFISNPSSQHLKAAVHVLGYLLRTRLYKLVFDGRGQYLEGFTDSDWGGDLDTRRSTTGFIFYTRGDAISWMSKLQPTVALSSVEAEYIAMSTAAREMVWLTQLLDEVNTNPPKRKAISIAVNGSKHALRSDDDGLHYDPEVPIISTDSAGARVIAENPQHHKRTKHVDIQHHFIRELVTNGKLKIAAIRGVDNSADLLTKPLPSAVIKHLCRLVGLHDERG